MWFLNYTSRWTDRQTDRHSFSSAHRGLSFCAIYLLTYNTSHHSWIIKRDHWRISSRKIVSRARRWRGDDISRQHTESDAFVGTLLAFNGRRSRPSSCSVNDENQQKNGDEQTTSGACQPPQQARRLRGPCGCRPL